MSALTARLLSIVTALLVSGLGVSQTPLFAVTTIDGRELSGAVTADAVGVQVAGKNGDRVTVALADLIAMRRVDVAAPEVAPAPQLVWLRSGAVLPATKLGAVVLAAEQPPRWSVDTVSGAHLELLQSSIAAVRCRTVEPDTFDVDREKPDQNVDYLYVVKDGKPQRFRVAIHGIRGGAVQFTLGSNDFEFPLAGDDSVAAMVFGKNTGFAPDRLPKPRVAVTLTGGEHCEGRLQGIDGALSLQLDEGVPLVVPIDRLRSVEIASDKLTWLSTLQPTVEQTPAFDRNWPWTVDASPAGAGIRLGGKAYTRGLVLVPRTRLTYALGGRFDAFEATIGIDERGGPQAHAIFRVFGDSKLLFESPPMLLGSAPQALQIELGRCQELTIEADFGKNFDLGDLCAFANARVVQH